MEENTVMTNEVATMTEVTTPTQITSAQCGVKVKFDCKSALIGGAAGVVAGVVGKIIFDKVRSKRLAKEYEEYDDYDEGDDYKEVDED